MCVASVYCVLVLNQAFCEPGKIEGNGVLAFLKFVIFPIPVVEVSKICLVEYRIRIELE